AAQPRRGCNRGAEGRRAWAGRVCRAAWCALADLHGEPTCCHRTAADSKRARAGENRRCRCGRAGRHACRRHPLAGDVQTNGAAGHDGAGEAGGDMTVYFIGAGPGDPDLLTIRGRGLIERCPICLYAGSLVPVEVVACTPPGARVIDTSSLHLDEIIALMAEAHAAGQDTVRVHSGDPSLYGAIAEQMRRLDALGIP